MTDDRWYANNKGPINEQRREFRENNPERVKVWKEKRREKQLIKTACEFCGVQYSGNYMQGHLIRCPKKPENKNVEKVKCEHCVCTFLPWNTKTHLKVCTGLNREQ